MDFTPTAEQNEIVSHARDTQDNMLIEALAGAAKTTTLVMIARALPNVNMLCLAFNKRIQLEMQERLPNNCQAQTLNSLGMQVWKDTISDRLKVDKDKTYNILSELVKSLPKKRMDEAYEVFADTQKWIGFGKACGYIPTGTHEKAKRLMDDDEYFNHIDEKLTPMQEELIRQVSDISIQRGLKGMIDFDDQLLLPTVFTAMFPYSPLVLIDEAQDLSALNHATLRKLAKKRIIGVGDSNQSIYGFRGAHQDSMELLGQTFSMARKTLSTSFRCPIEVVKAAQWRAPSMRWPEWAKPGSVTHYQTWDETNIPDDSAIICRNNAPLFGMAIKLLKNGRYPKLIGNDIGLTLVKKMKKFGKSDLPRSAVFLAIDEWETETSKKYKDPGRVVDQADCMRLFAEQGQTLGEAISYAEHLFAMQGPIQMMTGHKAKGLEFNNVFILDKDLINLERDQEKNLLYVMQTRAKETLSYITTSGFIDRKALPPTESNPLIE